MHPAAVVKTALSQSSENATLLFQMTLIQIKVIPWYCIAHPYCARVLRHQRVHVQNVRDFPQTKLDNGINSPFLLNKHGDPQFFFQVSAKNSLMKNILF